MINKDKNLSKQTWNINNFIKTEEIIWASKINKQAQVSKTILE